MFPSPPYTDIYLHNIAILVLSFLNRPFLVDHRAKRTSSALYYSHGIVRDLLIDLRPPVPLMECSQNVMCVNVRELTLALDTASETLKLTVVSLTIPPFLLPHRILMCIVCHGHLLDNWADSSWKIGLAVMLLSIHPHTHPHTQPPSGMLACVCESEQD